MTCTSRFKILLYQGYTHVLRRENQKSYPPIRIWGGSGVWGANAPHRSWPCRLVAPKVKKHLRLVAVGLRPLTALFLANGSHKFSQFPIQIISFSKFFYTIVPLRTGLLGSFCSGNLPNSVNTSKVFVIYVWFKHQGNE